MRGQVWRRVGLGLFLVLSLANSARAEPMVFHVDDGPESRFIDMTMHGGERQIFANGEITQGTAARFQAFVRVRGIDAAQVHFDSPGGSLIEGMALGKAIRRLGFSTAIGEEELETRSEAICASACAYAYAGGVSRYMSSGSGRLGIHQFYASAGSAMSDQDAQVLSGAIVAYLEKMGVKASAFSLSTLADPDGIIWLSPEDALSLRFANNGSLPTTSAIKIAEMRPYLRLEQQHHDVTARAIFFCFEHRLHLNYGIVTTPEAARDKPEWTKRSYLEVDGVEALPAAGTAGIEAADATVWIKRELGPQSIRSILAADQLDGWLDGFGAMRWGAQMEIGSVRPVLTDYAKQCFSS